jgi:hypothetical protein
MVVMMLWGGVLPDWVRLRLAAWWLSLVPDNDEIVVSCRRLGLNRPLRFAKRGCFPVDFVIVGLLKKASSHDAVGWWCELR